MKEGQNEKTFTSLARARPLCFSCFLENLRKKGLEVLYIVYFVDEYAVQEAESHNDGGLDFGDSDEKNKFEELNGEVDPITKLMEKFLGEKVETESVRDRSSTRGVLSRRQRFCQLYRFQSPHAVQHVTLARSGRSTLSHSTSQQRLVHLGRFGHQRRTKKFRTHFTW